MTALDWRGDWDVVSVPVCDAILANPYLHWSVREDTRAERDTARWLLAVRSRRWVAASATADYVVEENWWYVWRGRMAFWWAVSQRCGPPDGFLPSTELALRPRFGVDHLLWTDRELVAQACLVVADELESWRFV